MTDLFTDADKVEYSEGFTSPYHPFAIVLPLSYGITQKTEVGEVSQMLKWLQIPQLLHIIVREDERGQIWA